MTERQIQLQKRNKKIAKIYRSGKPLNDLGTPFGLKKQMVLKILHKQGISVRERSSKNKPKLTAEEKLKIKQIKFWNRAALTADSTRCWEWQGTISIGGYARTGWKGKIVYARRVAWQIYNGRVPANYILNSCDNSKCVNPFHLIESSGKQKIKQRLNSSVRSLL